MLVAVSDSVFPNLDPARAVLSTIGAELKLAAAPSAEAVLDVARDAEALLATYAKITGEMIGQLTRCRVISRFGIGVDNVDLEAATRAGIVVTKVPDYCIDEVSDHAVALLLALVRKVPSSNADVHAGRWDMRSVVPIHRLRGTTLGLLGFGRIPQLVAPKAQAFGVHVIAHDPYIPDEVFVRTGVERVSMADLLRRADYLSLHAPLTADTRGMIDASVLAQMKPTAYLINTARGPIVDEAALAQALDSGRFGGAALDVMPQEPPAGSPLLGRGNVIITPHTGFYSEESLVELQTKAAEEVVRVLSGRAPLNPVNPEVLDTSHAGRG